MQKVDLQNLKNACARMVQLINEISDPATDSSGARNFGFGILADEIRFELDGSASPVASVRARALSATPPRHETEPQGNPHYDAWEY